MSKSTSFSRKTPATDTARDTHDRDDGRTDQTPDRITPPQADADHDAPRDEGAADSLGRAVSEVVTGPVEDKPAGDGSPASKERR